MRDLFNPVHVLTTLSNLVNDSGREPTIASRIKGDGRVAFQVPHPRRCEVNRAPPFAFICDFQILTQASASSTAAPRKKRMPISLK